MPTHSAGLVAVAPAGSDSARDCERPPTSQGSLPDTILAPPDRVHVGAPDSKEPPGTDVYHARSPKPVNGWLKLFWLQLLAVETRTPALAGAAETANAAIAAPAATRALTLPARVFMRQLSAAPTRYG